MMPPDIACVSGGYDNSREITFVVDDAMLRNLQSDVGSDERSVPGAFDEFHEKVLEIAKKQYVGAPQNRYFDFMSYRPVARMLPDLPIPGFLERPAHRPNGATPLGF